jgi:hypothetical protein
VAARHHIKDAEDGPAHVIDETATSLLAEIPAAIERARSPCELAILEVS